MTFTTDYDLVALIYLRYGISAYEALHMINDWLKINPQASSKTLFYLFNSNQVFVKEKTIFNITHLSLDESRLLAQQIQQEGILEIKDRWYHAICYPKCFIGSELVDYFTQVKGKTIVEAMAIGKNLFEHDLIHHVCNDHEFKNEFLFYRFKD